MLQSKSEEPELEFLRKVFQNLKFVQHTQIFFYIDIVNSICLPLKILQTNQSKKLIFNLTQEKQTTYFTIDQLIL